MAMIETAMRDGSHYFDWTHLRRSGEPFPATVLLTRVEIDGQPLLQATVRDETEARGLKARADQLARLATMGLLAAGLGHELNNPLSYVLYNVDSLAEELPRLAGAVGRCAAALRDQVGLAELERLVGDDAELLQPAALEDAVDRARQALEGTRRIRDVSRRLRTFSRVEASERCKVDLPQVLEGAASMAHNEIRLRARLVKDLAPVPRIWATEAELSQVFSNLLTNAWQAIGDGAVEGNRITIRSWAAGGHVFAEVADSGTGIAPEQLERIFEPFFSTKRAAGCSGLGLAICKHIVTELGGDIRVEIEVGKGTRFVVRLPVQSEGSEERLAEVAVETR